MRVTIKRNSGWKIKKPESVSTISQENIPGLHRDT